jgi:hypothetical protein
MTASAPLNWVILVSACESRIEGCVYLPSRRRSRSKQEAGCRELSGRRHHDHGTSGNLKVNGRKGSISAGRECLTSAKSDGRCNCCLTAAPLT